MKKWIAPGFCCILFALIVSCNSAPAVDRSAHAGSADEGQHAASSPSAASGAEASPSGAADTAAGPPARLPPSAGDIDGTDRPSVVLPYYENLGESAAAEVFRNGSADGVSKNGSPQTDVVSDESPPESAASQEMSALGPSALGPPAQEPAVQEPEAVQQPAPRRVAQRPAVQRAPPQQPRVTQAVEPPATSAQGPPVQEPAAQEPAVKEPPAVQQPAQRRVAQAPPARTPAVQPSAVQPPAVQPPAAQAQESGPDAFDEEAWPVDPIEMDSSIVRESVPVPVGPPLPAQIQPVLPIEERIDFSRVVRATVGQIVEIPFRGSGWIYQGEMASRRGIVYDSQRQDTDGMSIIFRADAAGTYTLKFYKRDFNRDYILNDYVQVIIGNQSGGARAGWFDAPVDRGRVIAEPRWPLTPAEENQRRVTPHELVPQDGAEQAGGAAAARGPDVAAEAAAAIIPPNSPPDVYLKRAREEFDSGRFATSMAVLDLFRENYPSGSDEAYWLYGQLFESNSPVRDIRGAIIYYRRLVDEYPQSSRYNDARRRIAYLERYYINIQ